MHNKVFINIFTANKNKRHCQIIVILRVFVNTVVIRAEFARAKIHRVTAIKEVAFSMTFFT